MLNRDSFDQLARQIGDLFGQRELTGDIQRNLRAPIQASLTKMDLVTRDEFEVQAAILARTRAKIDQLETQLDELAQQLENGAQP